jgi:hypothetical protein
MLTECLSPPTSRAWEVFGRSPMTPIIESTSIAGITKSIVLSTLTVRGVFEDTHGKC